MELLQAEYNIVLLTLLGVFTLIAGALASATILNVIRLRNKRMTWRAGHLHGYPVFSTMFLMLSLILLGHELYNGISTNFLIFLLYFMMSSGWFLTSYFTSKRYITDNGIVKNINDPSQTIPWYQIRDFVEKDAGDNNHFIFLYRDNDINMGQRFIRLDLEVPERHTGDFKKLISHKLGRQLNCYDKEMDDISHLNLP